MDKPRLGRGEGPIRGTNNRLLGLRTRGDGEEDKEGFMAQHEVKITIRRNGRFSYNYPCLCVRRRDTIKWKLMREYPFGIMIKAVCSPLDKGFYVAAKGRTITAKVRRDAEPGYYPYGVGAYDGTKLLFDDPEIIVRRPGR